MSLAGELGEAPRTHPLGQRNGARLALPGMIEERVGRGRGHGRGNLAGVSRPLLPHSGCLRLGLPVLLVSVLAVPGVGG